MHSHERYPINFQVDLQIAEKGLALLKKIGY